MGRPRPPARHGARTLASARGRRPLATPIKQMGGNPITEAIVTGWPRRQRRLGERQRVERGPEEAHSGNDLRTGPLLKVRLTGVHFC